MALRLVPWYREPTAQVIHDVVYHDGTTVDVAPRQVLKNVIKKIQRPWTQANNSP